VDGGLALVGEHQAVTSPTGQWPDARWRHEKHNLNWVQNAHTLHQRFGYYGYTKWS
jgi:hypothetical protein